MGKKKRKKKENCLEFLPSPATVGGWMDGIDGWADGMELKEMAIELGR